jgi:hypothetical protein
MQCNGQVARATSSALGERMGDRPAVADGAIGHKTGELRGGQRGVLHHMRCTTTCKAWAPLPMVKVNALG